MPYNENGKWVYEYEVPTSGDSLRRAYMFVLRSIESYLFDEAHPGFAKPEYLSWAMEMSKAMHNQSGTPAVDSPRWNPATAGSHPIPERDGKVYDNGVRYHPASFTRPDHNTDPYNPARERFDSDLHDPAAERGETVQTNRDVDPAGDPRIELGEDV